MSDSLSDMLMDIPSFSEEGTASIEKAKEVLKGVKKLAETKSDQEKAEIDKLVVQLASAMAGLFRGGKADAQCLNGNI